MKKLIFLFFSILLLGSPDVSATHLLGGHLQYSYIKTEGLYQVYDITLTLYRDCRKDGTDEEVPFDADALLCVFKSDKSLYSSIVLSKTFEGSAIIQNPGSCEAAGTVCMKKALYKKTIKLQDSATGYFLLYERCCRGYYKNIKTDFNNDPFQGFSVTTFIPASNLKNNNPFYQNPHHVKICEGDTVLWDQSAIDPDQDSLSYTLVTTYIGANTTDPKPSECSISYSNPGPTDYVLGYKATDIFGNNGFSNLNDSNDLLSLFSVEKGLFLGCIAVTEWRNNLKISETRFDFTVLVDAMAGMEETMKYHIQIFPNPASHHVLVKGLPAVGNVWQLTNTLGVVVKEGKGTADLEIDISDLKTGMYYFRSIAGGMQFFEKVMICE